jgi:hypothetical protein
LLPVERVCCLRPSQASSSRGGFEKTAPSSDLGVRELLATVRGALIDLTWNAPDFDPTTRQLVGYELFRDDMSTRPPSRRTWRTVPSAVIELRGLEDLPRSEYGVQPIWRAFTGEHPDTIEYGPPSLSTDPSGASPVMVPPEERIRSLGWLQRDGLITSEEQELAVEQLLGPRFVPQPKVEIPVVPAVSTTPATSRRTLIAYGLAVVIVIVAAVAGAQVVGRLLSNQPSTARVVSSPSPAPPSPPSPSPTPRAVSVNLRSILVKPTDLRSGYVAGSYDSTPLCGTCVPVAYSLSVVIQDRQLHRSVLTGASVALTADQSHSVVQNLMSSQRDPWVKSSGLGNESYVASYTVGGLGHFLVVWRDGVIAEEIDLIAPQGSRSIQNAIDLAKLQQARSATALSKAGG